MARLIDGDGINLALVERGQSDKRFKWGETIRYAPSEVQQIINEDMPTVDAVPVVRCKDCKHRPTKPDDYNPITTDGFALEFPDEKCPCRCGDGWYSKYPDDDWYCPIGERKGGDE
ncbi:MAG: hypothetical protein II630_01490 [Bacteroidales bacterium]|nr:hypothetical protein [Bacteroidales bacterium]